MIEYDAKIEKIRIPLVTNEANEEQSHVYVLAIEEQSVSDQQYEGDCHMSHFIQDGHHSYAEPNQRRDIHSSSGDTQGDRYGSNQDVLYKNNQPTQRHCDVGVTPMENPPREATTENPPEVTTHNCLDKVDATKDLLKRNASDHPLERDATEGFLEGVTTENLMGNPPREASTENPPEVDEVDTIVKRNATDYPPEWDATKKTGTLRPGYSCFFLPIHLDQGKVFILSDFILEDCGGGSRKLKRGVPQLRVWWPHPLFQ